MLYLRGNIPPFIHVSEGKLHDINVLDLPVSEPGTLYVMDRGYLDYVRLYPLNQASAFAIRAKSNLRFPRVYSHSVDKHTGLRCDQTVMLTVFYPAQRHSDKLLRIKCYRLPGEQIQTSGTDNRRTLSIPLAGGTVFQMDQTAPADQVILRDIGKHHQDTGLDCRLRVRAGRHDQEAINIKVSL